MTPDNPILETLHEIEADVVDAAKAVAAEVKAVAAEIAEGAAALTSHCADDTAEDAKNNGTAKSDGDATQ